MFVFTYIQKLYFHSQKINYKKNSLPLCPNWFRNAHSGIRIKRESGENPVQSRCCETPLTF